MLRNILQQKGYRGFSASLGSSSSTRIAFSSSALALTADFLFSLFFDELAFVVVVSVGVADVSVVDVVADDVAAADVAAVSSPGG